MLVCRDRPESALSAAKSISGTVTLAGPRPEAEEVAPAILERLDQILDAKPGAHEAKP
jgi:lipopolysaccharide/colanic/teichoic acid biosynthesis glycosyltransferase